MTPLLNSRLTLTHPSHLLTGMIIKSPYSKSQESMDFLIIPAREMEFTEWPNNNINHGPTVGGGQPDTTSPLPPPSQDLGGVEDCSPREESSDGQGCNARLEGPLSRT